MMNRNFISIIFFKIISIFFVSLYCQSENIKSDKKFTGELYYQNDTRWEVVDPTPRMLELKSLLEGTTEQIFSYKDDILTTGVKLGDTSYVSLCSVTDVYTMFPPSKKKLKFKSSNEMDIRNYTKTNETKVIAGFMCNKYYLRVNDNILVEKWITPDFEYNFPQENMENCYSMFSEEGFEVARKSTSYSDNGDVKYNESLLVKYQYDPSYVRATPKIIYEEVDAPVTEYEMPEINKAYKSISSNNRKRIRLDSLINIDNEYINAESLYNDYTLISFWASWCKPCLESMPKLGKIFDLFSKDGLNVLSIMIDQEIDHAKWLDLIHKHKMKWSNVRAEDTISAKIKDRVGFITIPSYVLLDRNGRMVFEVVEGLNVDGLTIFLNELFAKDTE